MSVNFLPVGTTHLLATLLFYFKPKVKAFGYLKFNPVDLCMHYSKCKWGLMSMYLCVRAHTLAQRANERAQIRIYKLREEKRLEKKRQLKSFTEELKG